jgi:TPR repeat protein
VAERGNVKAMHNLAVAATRESANADFAFAAKWYAEAASAKNQEFPPIIDLF